MTTISDISIANSKPISDLSITNSNELYIAYVKYINQNDIDMNIFTTEKKAINYCI